MNRATSEIANAEKANAFWDTWLLRTWPISRLSQEERIRDGPLKDDLRRIEK